MDEDHREVNVETQRGDPESVWEYYRRLIDLRGTNDVLVYGSYENHTPDDEQVWAYSRTLADGNPDDGPTRAFVALNWSGERARVEPPSSLAGSAVTLALSNYPDASATTVEPYIARPWEARVYLWEN